MIISFSKNTCDIRLVFYLFIYNHNMFFFLLFNHMLFWCKFQIVKTKTKPGSFWSRSSQFQNQPSQLISYLIKHLKRPQLKFPFPTPPNIAPKWCVCVIPHTSCFFFFSFSFAILIFKNLPILHNLSSWFIFLFITTSFCFTSQYNNTATSITNLVYPPQVHAIFHLLCPIAILPCYDSPPKLPYRLQTPFIFYFTKFKIKFFSFLHSARAAICYHQLILDNTRETFFRGYVVPIRMTSTFYSNTFLDCRCFHPDFSYIPVFFASSLMT